MNAEFTGSSEMGASKYLFVQEVGKGESLAALCCAFRAGLVLNELKMPNAHGIAGRRQLWMRSVGKE